jgi:hypothetical protein
MKTKDSSILHFLLVGYILLIFTILKGLLNRRVLVRFQLGAPLFCLSKRRLPGTWARLGKRPVAHIRASKRAV